jgi:hypothetical protein
MASLAALTVALSLLAAPPQSQLAYGPEPSGTSELEDDREAAKAAFDRGLAAVARGEYQTAVAEFEQAYRIRPHPVTLFNLALALEKAGRLPESWELFDAVLDVVESDAERREVRRHMRTIGNEIAIVEIDAQPRRRLCIDGIAMPVGETSDYRLAVEAGRHQLLLDDHEFEVEFTAGDRRVLLLDDAEDFVDQRRRGPLMPAMVGVTIGSGALAVGLGIGAAVSTRESTRTGLAAGAAGSAGVAVVAGLVALLIETRTIADPTAEPRDRARKCPGSEQLERRLDLQLAPTITRPVEFASGPSMPVPRPQTAGVPELPIAPPRASAQKRPTTTTPM